MVYVKFVNGTDGGTTEEFGRSVVVMIQRV